MKPIDRDVTIECAKKYKMIVTCEEHNIVGGFGSAIAEILAETQGRKAFQLRIGLQDEYGTQVGNQKYLREQYGMSAKQIAARILRSFSA